MQNIIQIDPHSTYTVTLRGTTVLAVLEGLQEIPKKRADPAQEELATQVAMLAQARAAVASDPNKVSA